MKKIQFNKTAIRENWKKRKERRAQILEARKNSAFARKLTPYYKIMNRFSVIFHALWALIINFIIEALSRHSVVAAWGYMTGTPLVFLYNAAMIFITFIFGVSGEAACVCTNCYQCAVAVSRRGKWCDAPEAGNAV